MASIDSEYPRYGSVVEVKDESYRRYKAYSYFGNRMIIDIYSKILLISTSAWWNIDQHFYFLLLFVLAVLFSVLWYVSRNNVLWMLLCNMLSRIQLFSQWSETRGPGCNHSTPPLWRRPSWISSEIDCRTNRRHSSFGENESQPYV